MDNEIIRVEKVSKTYHIGNARKIVAVENLSLSIYEGEVVSIVGKTGCGKSTFFNMLLGLEPPSSGKITIEGKDPFYNFDYFRSKLGVVFQADRLMPWRTALDNAKIGLEILGYPPQEQIKIAAYWLHSVELQGFEKAYPYELSGGMRQRVGIARAFAVNPDILLCDEAFGHLDQMTAFRLRQVFLKLVKETQKTCLLITHNINEAIEIGSRIIAVGKPGHVLYDSAIPAFATKDELAKYEEMILEIIEKNEVFSLH